MDYFDEMGWEPVDAENTQQHQSLLLIRYMRDNGFWPEGLFQHELAPPASKQIVENLEQRIVKINRRNQVQNIEKCAICLKLNTNDADDDSEDDADDKSDVNGRAECEKIFKILPCTHSFHDTCILPWLEKTNSCPLCRYELKTDDESYEEMKLNRARAQQRENELEMLHNSMFG